MTTQYNRDCSTSPLLRKSGHNKQLRPDNVVPGTPGRRRLEEEDRRGYYYLYPESDVGDGVTGDLAGRRRARRVSSVVESPEGHKLRRSDRLTEKDKQMIRELAYVYRGAN